MSPVWWPVRAHRGDRRSVGAPRWWEGASINTGPGALRTGDSHASPNRVRAACRAVNRYRRFRGVGLPGRVSRGPGASGYAVNRQDEVVSRIFASWNHLDGWFRQLEALRRAA
jgi:hypothetical protein